MSAADASIDHIGHVGLNRNEILLQTLIQTRRESVTFQHGRNIAPNGDIGNWWRTGCRIVLAAQLPEFVDFGYKSEFEVFDQFASAVGGIAKFLSQRQMIDGTHKWFLFSRR
jgi:hypothetical protein